MAIWQRHVPSSAGKFCIHQVEADRAERWGAFFIPHRASASGLPKDLRDYRIWDTRELREHLLNSCTRTRLLEIAEQMKAMPSSSSCSKPSRKDLAKFIAEACVLPPVDAEPCQNTHIDRLCSSLSYEDFLRRTMKGEDVKRETVEKVLTILSDACKKNGWHSDDDCRRALELVLKGCIKELDPNVAKQYIKEINAKIRSQS
ncbi:unnamed protein product [Symbiodinium natans]|uniref:Uncharacterized protein n=1 Tax=Symbiodinium natans TaxID=878477 RepID=A0A812RWE4_9DINO|nr:unnamed protein product [Symbiodinium natans]